MQRPGVREKSRAATAKYRNSDHGKKHIVEYYTSREYRDKTNAYQREYRERPEVKFYQAVKQRKYRLRNCLKEKARAHAHFAIRIGKIARPAVCDWCGMPLGEQSEMHHWRGYDPAFWLDVKFLHPACHNKCENVMPEDWPGVIA